MEGVVKSLDKLTYLHDEQGNLLGCYDPKIGAGTIAGFVVRKVDMIKRDER